MKAVLILALIALAGTAQANVIKSDCTPAEMKVLQHANILTQFISRGRILAQDCVPVTLSPERQVLLVAHVLNSPTGYETYLALFERKGFSESSTATFKSSLLGFDLFPVLFKGNQRLVFVHPSSDKTKIAAYLNVQQAPGSSKLARWELALDKYTLTEQTNRYWPLEAGIMPKIYDDKGVYRALIESRSVEL